MPIDPARLKQLIAARRFEDFGRRLREAGAAELAAAHIDLEEQKFDAAAARLEPMIHSHPELTSVRALIEHARTCSSIAGRFAAARQAPREAPDYAVFAINLDEQTLRFENLKA